MKKAATFLILVSCAAQLPAQNRYVSYLEKAQVRLLDLDDYLTPEFKWNMNGSDQVSMNEGINLLDEGNYDKAILNLTNLLSRNSKFTPALYYRGVAYKRLQKYDEARNDFQAAMRSDPKMKEAFIEYGELLHLKGDVQQAEKQYRNCIKIDKTFAEGFYHLGILSLDAGENDAAGRYFQDAVNANPHYAPALVGLAINTFQTNADRSKSLDFFNKAILADSTYRKAYIWRGLALLALYHNEDALLDWDRCVAFFPTNTFIRVMHGCASVELRRFDDAFSDFRKVVQSNNVKEDRFMGNQSDLDRQVDLKALTVYLVHYGYGLDPEAFRFLKAGLCLLVTGKSGAIDQFEASARMQPSACAYYALGFGFEQNNSHPIALVYYKRAVVLDSNILDAHKKLAIYYSEQKKWDACFAEIAQMLRIQPESIVAYRLSGYIKAGKKDYAGAISDLKKVLELDSADIDALKNIAVCKEEIGDYPACLQDISALLTKEPGNANLYEMKVRNHLLLKDTANAISTCKYARKMVDVPVPHIQLARIYIAQKKLASATSEVDQVFTVSAKTSMVYPDYFSEGFFLKGLISQESGDPAQAIVYFDKAIKLKFDNLECRYYRALINRGLGNRKRAEDDLKFLAEKGYRDSAQHLAALRELK